MVFGVWSDGCGLFEGVFFSVCGVAWALILPSDLVCSGAVAFGSSGITSVERSSSGSARTAILVPTGIPDVPSLALKEL